MHSIGLVKVYVYVVWRCQSQYNNNLHIQVLLSKYIFSKMKAYLIIYGNNTSNSINNYFKTLLNLTILTLTSIPNVLV